MKALDLDPFHFEGGPTGCLLVHGFSGSPPEMRPMGEYLASRGLTVVGVRLAGHGASPEDMAWTTWRDWAASAEAGLQMLREHCDRLFVAGLSMGGLIALHLAAHNTLAGVVAMATPAYIADWRFHFLPLARHVVRWYIHQGDSDLTDPEAEGRFSAYDRVPTSALNSLRQLLRLVRRELPRVRIPVLIMQGRHDRSIPLDSPQIIHDGLGTSDKEVVWWPNSGHCMTIDSDREAVWARAHDFIIAHAE